MAEDSHEESTAEEQEEDYTFGGYHPVQIGERFKDGRYVVLNKLGWGQYSTVWVAWDTHQNKYVALKVQRGDNVYFVAATHEVQLLKEIREKDPKNEEHVVKLLDHFDFAGPNGKHACMVFEFLGDSLLTLIQMFEYNGLPFHKVKEICYYILKGLDYLHTELNIIHTDLKPENILLTNPIETEADPPRYGSAPKIPEDPKNPTENLAEKVETVVAEGNRKANKPTDAPGLTDNQRKRLRKKIRKKKKQVEAHGNKPRTMKVKSLSNPENPGNNDREPSGNVQTNLAQAEAEKRVGHNRERTWNIQTQKLLSEAAKKVQNYKEKSRNVQKPLSQFGLQKKLENNTENYGNVQTKTARSEATKKIVIIKALPPAVGKYGPHKRCKLLENVDVRCKIVDIGTACKTDKHLNERIQTIQYRSPEAILQAGYDTSTDMWSFGCIAFELMTGDYLFEPYPGNCFTRSEDHLALMMELLGPIPHKVKFRGDYSKVYFNENGELRSIKKLNYWPLHRLLKEKYLIDYENAISFSHFLLSVLNFDPEKRLTAQECLLHPWLKGAPDKLEPRRIKVKSYETEGPEEKFKDNFGFVWTVTQKEKRALEKVIRDFEINRSTV